MCQEEEDCLIEEEKESRETREDTGYHSSEQDERCTASSEARPCGEQIHARIHGGISFCFNFVFL